MDEKEINYNADELKFPDEENIAVGETLVDDKNKNTYQVEGEPSPSDTLHTPAPTSPRYKPPSKSDRKNYRDKQTPVTVRLTARTAKGIKRNLDMIIILLQSILLCVIVILAILFGHYYNFAFDEAKFEKIALIVSLIIAFLTKFGLDVFSIFIKPGRLIEKVKMEMESSTTYSPEQIK